MCEVFIHKQVCEQKQACRVCATQPSGTLRVVEALLAAGADVHARCGSEGATALHMASGRGHTSCCLALLQVRLVGM